MRPEWAWLGGLAHDGLHHVRRLVTFVDISNTAIGPLGADTLADSLHDAPLLQVLKLRGCSLIHTSKGEVGLCLLLLCACDTTHGGR